MPRSRDELTAGEWSVLALLDEAPAHGFAVARAMDADGEVGRIWSMRRPLVYRAIDLITGMGLVHPTATEASPTGPQRTLLEPTPDGREALARWLAEPVEHVRDGRSLLMLKLLFLTRRDADLGPLLRAQRERFADLVTRMDDAVARAEGFDRAVVLWRLESTTAALRFVETMLQET
jgi:DNA-binding PadR family transcriptional regulator